MAPPMDDAVLQHMLSEQYARAAIHAQAEPARDIALLGTSITQFATSLLADRVRFDEMAAKTTRDVRLITEADHFIPKESREGCARIEALLRRWSKKFGDLHIDEEHPLAAQLSAWVRPYNDSLTSLQRALWDSADGIARRLAEEAEEDAEAERWVAENGSLRGDEDVVPWEDVKAKLGTGT